MVTLINLSIFKCIYILSDKTIPRLQLMTHTYVARNYIHVVAFI